jgi:enamine deaminase RidA (YjgF/YER057c/UK114 family)
VIPETRRSKEASIRHLERPSLLAVVSLLVLPGAATGQDVVSPEERLRELGIELPAPYAPVANYVRAVRSGSMVFLGGHGPCEFTEDARGKVERDRTIDEAYETARRTGICLLASLKDEIGDLSKVKRIVRVFGMVNSDESFTQHSQVINGCSDLLIEVFGERGRHARAAVGMASLPFGLTVEIEMIVEVSAD